MIDDWVQFDNLSGGAQGTTHLVKRKDDETGQIYVIKKLTKKKDLEKALGRFRKEIRAGLELKYPNVLEVVDSDVESEKPFLVSKYCSGGTLKNLDLENLTTLDKLKIFLQICDGVGYAHTNHPQIIHRDLKPENIFLKEDGKTPVVGDFGICFIDKDGQRLTLVDGEAVGARGFTAPELENGRNDSITPASDVYSLGKVLYWMLAGKILARENHNEENWDLRKQTTDPAIFFIYELFDETIIEAPEKRLKDATEVAANTQRIINKIMKGGHPLDFNVPQECLYCGEGIYKKFFESRNESFLLQLFPFTSINDVLGYDNSKWLNAKIILICNICGNEQYFRPFPNGWGTGKWKGLLPKGMS